MRAMREFGIGILMTLVIAFVWLCCAQPSPTTPTPSPTTPTTYSLTTAGGTPGGVGYAIMSATMSVASKYYPEISYTIAPGGWVGNIPRVDTGELDIAHTTVVGATLAKLQKGPFEGKEVPQNVRGVFVDQIEIYYYIVARADFPYNTVEEIAAAKYPVKVGNQAKGTLAGWLWDEVFEVCGIGEKTLLSLGGKYTRFGDWSEAASLLRDGHIDVILAVSGKKVGWLEELTAQRDVKYIGVTEETANKISEKYGLKKVVIQPGTLSKQKDEIIGFTETGYIIANKDVPKEVIKKIVMAIAQHSEEFKKAHSMLETFEPGPKMYEGSPFPLHPGAIEAYKELGYMK